MISQIAAAVYGQHTVLFYLFQAATAAILILAANTAFNGFPTLASILARDGYPIVLVSRVHKPALRALAFARATGPSTLTALTVNIDTEATRELERQWSTHEIPVPLRIVESPYREVTRPILEYVKELRRDSPRDVITVFIPEYVLMRWWQYLLHNQSALRLKARLLFTPGVMVVNVPFQLGGSSQGWLATEQSIDKHQQPAGASAASEPSRTRDE